MAGDKSIMASTVPNHPTASDILERQPPFDLAAERGVLGSVILKPDVLDDVVLMLRSEDFYDDAHQVLYREICIMHDEGKMIDPTLLVSRLKASGQWESMGGAQFLATVSKSVANAAHVIYYAELVREKATYRSLIDVATEIVREAYNQTDDARALLSASEQKIFSIVDDRGSSSVAPLNEILHLQINIHRHYF